MMAFADVCRQKVATGKLDQETWNELIRDATAPVIVEYKITEQDVKGPFAASIPHDPIRRSEAPAPAWCVIRRWRVLAQHIVARRPRSRWPGPSAR
jgi:hypothetical protein